MANSTDNQNIKDKIGVCKSFPWYIDEKERTLDIHYRKAFKSTTANDMLILKLLQAIYNIVKLNNQ